MAQLDISPSLKSARWGCVRIKRRVAAQISNSVTLSGRLFHSSFFVVCFHFRAALPVLVGTAEERLTAFVGDNVTLSCVFSSILLENTTWTTPTVTGSDSLESGMGGNNDLAVVGTPFVFQETFEVRPTYHSYVTALVPRTCTRGFLYFDIVLPSVGQLLHEAANNTLGRKDTAGTHVEP